MLRSAYAPDPVWGMASTSLENQFMLVHGGVPKQSASCVGTTFALRLNTSWNTSQPDIVQLLDGFPGNTFASALSSDNRTWFVVANSTPHKFHIGNGTWTDLEYLSTLTNETGLRAATDPVSGMIYFANGLSINGSHSMLQYNLTTDTSSAIPMDSRTMGLSDSAAVWSTARGSMLVHGGIFSGSEEVQQRLYEFDPNGDHGENIGKGTLLPDKGDLPGPRKGHCLVPAYGGSKLILFGGFIEPQLGQHVSSGIYSLDVNTLTWTKLTDPEERYARAYHACAVSNDMFVSWGGADSKLNALRDNTTLVYNLKTNVWQTFYSPLPEEGDANERFSNYSSLSLAVIASIVAGSMGNGLVAGYVLYRKR
ncbi:unnamed protein product [Mortierella alpina]